MPELPETETIARDLNESVAGSRIVKVTVTKPDVLRELGKTAFARRLAGSRLIRTWRRAKLVVSDLETGFHLVVQPRFTGALIVETPGLDRSLLAYSALRLALDDGRALHYCDARRLGTVTLMDAGRFAGYSAALGKEPLDPDFTAEQLSGVLRGSSQPVKKVLMDQRRIAGIGNIYANEALWRAGIDPSRAARSIDPDEARALHEAMIGVLTESIALRGTTFRDYRDSRGERGSFAAKLQAYGREGQPCMRCRATLIGTHAVDGRATVFCARCQA